VLDVGAGTGLLSLFGAQASVANLPKFLSCNSKAADFIGNNFHRTEADFFVSTSVSWLI
jgi:hypothetical protein